MMAYVKSIVRDDHEIRSLHPTIVECRYVVAEKDGRKLFQLNSYGSSERQMPDKLSQTLQFDETAARRLWELLEKEFSFGRGDLP